MSVTIKGGAAFTNSRNVNLTLDGSGAAATSMRVSEDNTFGGPNQGWQQYSTTTPFILSSGDGPKTVYAQFRDSNLQTSNVVSDGITLDTVSPSSEVTDFGGPQSTAAFTVSWSGTDATSGIATYDVQVRDDGVTAPGDPGSPGTWTNWKTAVSALSGTYSGSVTHRYCFRARATDNAGNVEAYPSAPDTCTRVADNAKPTSPSVSINGGATYTTSGIVSLTLSAADNSGVTEMEVSEDPAFGDTSWQPYATSTLFQLSSGDGPKTVYAQFRDLDLNPSNPATDGITLDTTQPTSSVTGLAAQQSSTSFTVSWSGADASGIATYDVQVRDDGLTSGPGDPGSPGTWTAWKTNVSALSGTYSGAQAHRYCFRVRSTDSAGNQGLYSTPPECTRAADLSGPTGASISINTGATYATSHNVTLSLSATDNVGVTQMRVSEDTTFGGGAQAWVDYATSLPFTLSAGDGAKTVFAQFRDGDHNVSTKVSDGITVDTTAPSSSVTSLAGSQSSATFPVSWSGSDALAGIASYTVQVRDDDVTPPGGTGTPGTWTNWKTATTLTSGSYPGALTHRYCFRVRATDNVGNVEDWPAGPDTCTRVADSVAPTNPGIAANGGAAYATSRTVTLSLSASDNAAVTEMEISEDSAFSGAAWQPYVTSISFQLSTGDGAKTVFARFRDLDHNVSAKVSDGIVLDTTPPSSSVSNLASEQSSPTFTVSWSGTDALSGIASYNVQVRDDGVTPPGGTGTPDTWTNWKTATTLTSASYPGSLTHRYCFRVRATDKVGNVEDWPATPDTCTRVADNARPTSPVISINGGATYAGSRTVNLSLSASDNVAVTEMELSEDSGFSGAAWQPYATSLPFQLASGDGPKTVYARFRDLDHNVSTAASDGITLDTTAPSSAVTAFTGAQTSASFMVSWSGTDARSGIESYDVQVRDDGATPPGGTGTPGTWSAWRTGVIPTQTSGTYHGALTHRYCFRSRATDNLGNVEAWPNTPDTCTRVEDNVAPTGAAVSINGGATYANSRTVTLNLSASDNVGVTEMEISESPSFSGAVWQPYATSLSFQLSSGDGAKTVYARFHDLDHNASTKASDGISVDTTAPSSSVTNLASQQSSPTFAVSWAGTDALSGIASYNVQVRDDGVTPPGGSGSPGSWVNWKTATSLTSGSYPGALTHRYCFRVRATDHVGNVEDWPSTPDTCTRVADTARPASPAISINGGATYATSHTVTLSLSATDNVAVTQMRVSEDTTFGGGAQTWVAYATSVPFTLSTGDGAKTVFAQFRDGDGNISNKVSDGITVDRTAPSSSVTHLAGDQSSTSFIVSWTGTDALSGIASYDVQVRDDGVTQRGGSGTPGTWTAWKTGVVPTQTSGTYHGSLAHRYCFRVRATDNVGNVEGWPATPDTCTRVSDNTAPTGAAISISGGATYATSRSVTLSLSATDNVAVTQMRVSEDGTFDGGAQAWVAYATSLPFTLSSGDGGKTVYAQFRDGDGNVSTKVSDGIKLDSVAPTSAVADFGGDQTSPTFTVSWTGTDATSGIASYYIQVRDDGVTPPGGTGTPGTWSNWRTSTFQSETYQGSITHRYCFRSRAVDNAGNLEPWPSAPDACTRVADNARPTSPSISINNGAAYAKSRTVSLDLSASDNVGVTEVELSERADFSGAAWRQFASSLPFTLSSGDGQKTVYARFRDLDGNVSNRVSDSIGLDTTGPSSRVDAFAGSQTTASFTVTWSGTDATSGITSYGVQVRDDGVTPPGSTGTPGTWTNWRTTTSQTSGTYHGALTHRYCFRSRAIDSAGNVEPWPSTPDACTRVADNAPPTSPAISINGGAGHTKSQTVKLTLSASDNVGVTEMEISESSSFSGATWQPYDSSVSFELSAGAGQKTVYARFRDLDGNVSAKVSDSIVLDPTGP